MNRTVTRRRRVRPRFEVEALESRYVLSASLATVALAPPIFGPPRANDIHTAPIQIHLDDFAPPQAPSSSLNGDSATADSATPADSAMPAAVPLSTAPSQPQVEIDIFRVEVRDPFIAREQLVFVETFTFQSFTEVSNRPLEPASDETVSFDSPNQGHLAPAPNAPGSNTSPLEQSGSTNAIRSEEAAASVTSNRPDGVVANASIAARRLDSVGASALPTDRRVDRPVPTAFATALAADAVRPADTNVHESIRPLSTPGDLSTPHISVPAAEPQGVTESTPQSMPVEQARDAVFGGLLVDGFAPRLLDSAFRALKSVEANLEAPDGSRWYRIALGCWVVAAALAYEAGRQSQNSTARALRYVSATLREPDPEDDDR